MRTSFKAKKSKPPSKGQTPRGFARSRGDSQPPGRRSQFSRTSTQPAAPGPGGWIGRRSQRPRASAKPAAKGSSGLIGRAQATLPGRKPTSKKSGVKGVLSSIGSAKNRAVARKPSKKDIVRIVAGGLGVAAVAKRRRAGLQDETPATPPVTPSEASAAEESLMVPPLRPVETSGAGDSPPTRPPLQAGELGRAKDIPPVG